MIKSPVGAFHWRIQPRGQIIGEMMRALVFIVAVLASTTALAEPPNNTPQALACMKKNGFTYAQWRAYQVPAAQANAYRACRDAKR